VWADDVELMRKAHVNLVTVGVFSWSRLQPGPDEFDFGSLDRVLDLLDAAGIGVCLATPTASPPPWFTRLHPDAMPVTRDGIRLTHGSRDTYCVNAPAYREASTRIAGLALRRASRGAPVARAQRIRHAVLLRALRRRVPGLAGRAVRRHRRAQRGVEHGLLVATLPGVGRGSAASGDAVSEQPGAGARLPQVRLRLDAAPLHRPT
jgi:hypothetical protein